MMTAGGCAPSNPAPPCAHFRVGGAPKNHGLFLQNLHYVSGNFHTFGPFSERVVIFQVSEAIYDAKMSLALKWLTNYTVFVKTGLNVLKTRNFTNIHKIMHFLTKINHLTCGG